LYQRDYGWRKWFRKEGRWQQGGGVESGKDGRERGEGGRDGILLSNFLFLIKYNFYFYFP